MSVWTDFSGLPIRQTFYNAKGIRTRVIEGGEQNGEVLICLHGTGGHAEAFSRNFRAHIPHYRMISMDMIGHGYTDAPDIDYTLQTLVDHLGDMVATLGCKRVAISGESLGAMVGAHYAIQNPDRVSKLVMTTGLLVGRTSEDRVALKDVLDRSLKATGALTRETIRARLAWLMHKPERDVTDELVELRHTIYSQPGRAQIMSRISNLILGGLLDDAWIARWSNEQELRKLQCQVLLVWSTYNPDLSAAAARAALPNIPRGEMVVLEDSAHWPQWEETARFDETQLRFLKSA